MKVKPLINTRKQVVQSCRCALSAWINNPPKNALHLSGDSSGSPLHQVVSGFITSIFLDKFNGCSLSWQVVVMADAGRFRGGKGLLMGWVWGAMLWVGVEAEDRVLNGVSGALFDVGDRVSRWSWWSGGNCIGPSRDCKQITSSNCTNWKKNFFYYGFVKTSHTHYVFEIECFNFHYKIELNRNVLTVVSECRG